jgi:uncharacterized low-complexity protein
LETARENIMKIRIAIIAASAATFALAQMAPAQAAQTTSISNHKPPPGKAAKSKAGTGTAKQPINDQSAGGISTKQK